MIEPYVRPEFEEFSGSVGFRLVYDAIGEALREIDQQLEAVGPMAFEIAMKSRGYVKERTCTNELLPDKYKRNFFKCSACGCTVTDCENYRVSVYTSDGAVGWSYCPHCGSKVVSK